MIDWMTVAFMFVVFINACMFGAVVFLVMQLARLLNPNLYRRQVISNKQKTQKVLDGGPLKIKPKEMIDQIVKTEPNKVIKDFVESQ